MGRRASGSRPARLATAAAAFPVDLGGSTDQATIFDVDEGAARREPDPAASLADYLAGLPISSVGQKHTAVFECDTSASNEGAAAAGLQVSRPNESCLTNYPDERAQTNFEHNPKGEEPAAKLVWVKLVMRDEGARSSGLDADITPLSLNRRVIAPDKRFKVRHQPPHKWLLSIENVGQADDKAYYLCQSSEAQRAPQAVGASDGRTANFIGGARLNVLVPPRLVEEETSPSLVSANEYEPLRLACKVAGEPQAQITWRREDGGPLEGLEQRFKHQLDRSQAHRLISLDLSELLFGSIRREQAGAYLVSCERR